MLKKLPFLRIAAIVIACMVLVVLAATWFMAGALIVPTPRMIGDAPSDLQATSFVVESDSGSSIHGWHTQGQRDKGVIVLLHGIRASRLAMVERARWLGGLGYSTVLIDLQAHGESPGEHITVGYLERHDVRAAVAFARREHPHEPIGIIGVSLGGASALLASPLDIDALVLESVYTDIDTAVHNRMVSRFGLLAPIPTALLIAQLQPRLGISPSQQPVADVTGSNARLQPRLGISPSQLRPIDHIAHVACPVFVLSGTADKHTTLVDTEALYANAVNPKLLWLVEGAAHVDLLNYAPLAYKDRVVAFFDEHFRGYGANPANVSLPDGPKSDL